MAFRRITAPVTTFRNSLTERLNSIELPERFKGTIVEKWTKYWRQVSNDYKDMALDTGRDMRDNKVRTSIYATLIGGIYLCCKNNPEEQSYYEEIRKCSNDVMVVGEGCQNPKTTEYLTYLERCTNEGIVRRLTLGVVSFIWLDNYSEDLGLYKTTCTYLKPEYLKFHERVIDVGFWNKWWTLSEKMIDYDINEDNL